MKKLLQNSLRAASVLACAATLLASGSAGAQELRIGGGSGPFQTNALAAAASYANITKVYRLLATGGAIATTDVASAGAAAIGGKGVLQDFIVLEGTLKDSNAPASQGLGRPGGGSLRTYISGGGASGGLVCSSTTPGTTSFPNVFGFDGVAGSGDDPGSDGLGAVGIPPGWPAPSATPPINLGALNRPALVQGATKIKSTYVDVIPAALRPTWSVGAASELVIVDIDADGDGFIKNRDLGAALPRATIAAGGNETSNLAQSCDLGVSPVPPSDFEDSAISAIVLNNPVQTGLQIAKIVVNRNVRAKSDSTKKIQLSDPQLENLFANADYGNATSWSDVGGQVVGDAEGKITVCFRDKGSGIREVIRNTFFLDGKGSKDQANIVGTFPGESFIENDPGGNTLITNKRFIQVTSNGDSAVCAGATGFAAGTNGNIAYVNASRKNAAQYYSVPIYGVDPDAQTAAQLRNLVKCGQWPVTGPLTVGRGPGADPLGLRDLFITALSTEAIYDPASSTAADYLPFGPFNGGVAYQKDVTAGSYFLKFKPNDCLGLVPNAPLAP